MPLQATVSLALSSLLTGSLDIERLTSQIDKTWRIPLSDGTGAGQATRIWSDTRTLASAASENIDLNGALTDAFGAALNLTKVKAILIAADPANTTKLTIGNVANGIAAPFGAATHSIEVPPGGLFLIATPDVTAFGVTAATADLLRVANAAGGAATYDIVLIGIG
jgi:hypothetical protein